MKSSGIARFVVICLLAGVCSLQIAAQGRAFQLPQYDAIRKQLIHGWGTWDSSNILEQVYLPDDAVLCLSFKQTNWIGNEFLKTALIGTSNSGEQVRPGLHALDGSYSEFELKWKTLEARISSAVADGDGRDLVMLIEPLRQPSPPVEMFIGGGFLWNHAGTVSREAGNLEFQTESGPLHVFATEQQEMDPYAGVDTPYLAVRLNQAVGISTGKHRSLDDIRAILSRKRESMKARAAEFGDKAETYSAIESVLAWNTIYEPTYDRIITTVGRLWNQEYGGYGLFGWDNFFLAYMTSLYSQDLSYANFIEHLRSMTNAGFIPNDDRGNGTKSWDHSQPPVGALMLKEIYKRYPAKWLLEASLPDLLRWNQWWFEERMNEGLLSYGSNMAENPYNAPDTHTKITAGYESGMDDSPMYTDVPFNSSKNMLELQDVGLNSLYIADCNALEEIALVLGRVEDARKIEFRRSTIQSHMTSLWNPQAGLYLNRRTDTGAFSTALSPTMFYPLIAKIVDESRAKEMVHDHLMNDAEFHGEFMLPSVSRDNPVFPTQRYWKGAVWPPLNFLVYLGLRNYGSYSAARELAEKSNAMFVNEWQKKGIISENYSAITGTGDDSRLSSDRFHSWGALMGFMSIIEAGKMPLPERPLSAIPDEDRQATGMESR